MFKAGQFLVAINFAVSSLAPLATEINDAMEIMRAINIIGLVQLILLK